MGFQTSSRGSFSRKWNTKRRSYSHQQKNKKKTRKKIKKEEASAVSMLFGKNKQPNDGRCKNDAGEEKEEGWGGRDGFDDDDDDYFENGKINEADLELDCSDNEDALPHDMAGAESESDDEVANHDFKNPA
eukprot:jgi/Bigna1/136649/aug1.35_g11357